MASRDNQGEDADETDEKRCPMEYDEPLRWIYKADNNVDISGLIKSRSKLTLLDGEVSHGQRHCVTGEDIVAAVDVLPVDRKAASRKQSYHPPGNVLNIKLLAGLQLFNA